MKQDSSVNRGRVKLYLDDKKVIQIGANYLTNMRPYVLFYKKK